MQADEPKNIWKDQSSCTSYGPGLAQTPSRASRRCGQSRGPWHCVSSEDTPWCVVCPSGLQDPLSEGLLLAIQQRDHAGFCSSAG